MIEDWKKQVIEDLANLRKTVSQKADKSMIEQISRNQEEKNRKSISSDFVLKPKSITDPERVCRECVENGEIESAFLTAIRYIESISATKADIESVGDKATREYVESLFERLSVINRQQIADANSTLRDTIEARLNELTHEFDSFSKSIAERVSRCECAVAEMEEFVSTNQVHTPPSTLTLTNTPNITPVSNKTPRKKPSALSFSQPLKGQKRNESNPDLLLSALTIKKRLV